jgi:hypothetical protein
LDINAFPGVDMGTFLRFALLCGTIVGMANAWNSTLMPGGVWTPPDSTKSFSTAKVLQDFHYAGYRMGQEPPVVNSPVLNVTQAPWNADRTGTNDATAAIQAALDSAGRRGGAVVYLPAGTYKLSVTSNNRALHIANSNVVLRGAGPRATFLLNTTTEMNGKTLITASGSSSWTTNGSKQSNITRDLDGPTCFIPVQDASQFKVGDWVILRNTITEDWIAEHKEPDWSGYGNSFSGLLYNRQILAITGNTLEIDIPIRYTLRTRDQARVYSAFSALEEVGIEDLAIGNLEVQGSGWAENDYSNASTAAYHTHNSWLIGYFQVRHSWIRNVHSYQPSQNALGSHLLSNGIRLNHTRNVTITGCDMRRPLYGGGGGNGYMYRLQAQENLLVNSKASESRHGFVLSHMVSSGNVFHQVIDSITGKQRAGTGTTSGKGSDHHMHFSHSNLFDQVRTHSSYFEAAYRAYGSAPLHNLTAAHGTYYNITGNGTGSQVVHTQQSRYGYVIGTQGPASGVNTSNRPASSGVKTDPVDHVEGVGQGATLQPQSLYQYQMDLVAPPPVRPRLGTLTPAVGTLLELGDTLFVAAEVIDPDLGTLKIDLWLNGIFLRSEAIKPYDWGKAGQDSALKNLGVGNHSLRFLLHDAQGLADSAFVSFQVEAPVNNLKNQESALDHKMPSDIRSKMLNWDLLGRLRENE